MHILHIALTGDGAPGLWHHVASGGAIDGLAVFTKPLAHTFQAFEPPVGVREALYVIRCNLYYVIQLIIRKKKDMRLFCG